MKNLSFERILRIGLALLIFCVLTILHGSWSLIGGMTFWLCYGIVWLLPIRWKIPIQWNPVRHEAADWMLHVWHSCYRFCFQQTMTISEQYPPEPCRTPGIKILVIGPHMSTLETILALYAVRQVSRWVVVSLKGWYFWLPFIGQGLWATGCGVFILRLHELKWVQRWPWLHRQVRDITMNRIRNKMQQLRTAVGQTIEAIIFVVFTDSRWRQQRATEQLARYAATVPGLGSWIDQMLMSRSGGFLEALRQNGDVARVIQLTMVGHRPLADGWTNFNALFGTRWLLAYRDVTDELVVANGGNPDLRTISEEAVRYWLNEVHSPWVVENIIRPWRST